MDATNHFDNIERYLEGDLSGAELTAFETALKTDSALDEEVRTHLLLQEALFAVEEDEVRANIKQWRSEGKNELKVVHKKGGLRSLKFTRLAIAASVAVLLGVGTFLWMPQQYSNEAILASYYELDESFLSGDRGSEDSEVAANALKGAAQYYKEEDYGKAAEVYLAFPDDPQALYALGHTFYKSESYEQAIQTFKKLVAKNSLQYQEKAEWYLVLSYLAAGKTEADFRSLLDKIIAGGGFYSAKAQSIKEDVDSFWR